MNKRRQDEGAGSREVERRRRLAEVCQCIELHCERQGAAETAHLVQPDTLDPDILQPDILDPDMSSALVRMCCAYMYIYIYIYKVI